MGVFHDNGKPKVTWGRKATGTRESRLGYRRRNDEGWDWTAVAGSFVVIGCSATVSEGEAEGVASATQADTALTVAQAPNPSPACNGATGVAVQCLNAFFPSCMGNYTTSELLDALCANTPNTAQNVITACVPVVSLLNKVVQCGIVLPANLMAAYVNYIYANSNPGQYQANGQTYTAGGIGPANQSECTVNGQPGQFQTSVLGTTCVPIGGGGGAPRVGRRPRARRRTRPRARTRGGGRRRGVGRPSKKR